MSHTGRKQHRRRTRSEIAKLESQIEAVLTEEPGQSVRHVFYRMTDPRLDVSVAKTESGYRQVQQRCLSMRRDGTIPYYWITDSTRMGWHVHTYDGPADFLRRTAGLYRSILWTSSQPHVEVWCESRSIAGTLLSDCQQLAVSLYPAGGFASDTLCHDAAMSINNLARERAVVIYIGDYDPSGVLIDQDIERKMRSHLHCPLDFKRIAINQNQIDLYGLPAKPRKTTDRRRLDIQTTVEAEAMPAGTLRGILRSAVEHYLPAGALKAAKVAEESEKQTLYSLCDIIS